MHTVIAMKRDCPTSKMSRIDLHHLLDASAAPERQMETIRMPKLQVQELNAVPEAVTVADGTPPDPLDVSSQVTRPIPPDIDRVESLENVRIGRGLGDVYVIGTICTLAMTVCGALAWL